MTKTKTTAELIRTPALRPFEDDVTRLLNLHAAGDAKFLEQRLREMSRDTIVEPWTLEECRRAWEMIQVLQLAVRCTEGCIRDIAAAVAEWPTCSDPYRTRTEILLSLRARTRKKRKTTKKSKASAIVPASR